MNCINCLAVRKPPKTMINVHLSFHVPELLQHCLHSPFLEQVEAGPALEAWGCFMLYSPRFFSSSSFLGVLDLEEVLSASAVLVLLWLMEN